MNQPSRKYFDENNNKKYHGNLTSIGPNRQQRRYPLQKQARDLMFSFSDNDHFVQIVFNKKQNSFIKILHQK